ncbi:MAG: nucleotide-binding universal stress UspA family protein [Marinoscillum sp.]
MTLLKVSKAKTYLLVFHHESLALSKPKTPRKMKIRNILVPVDFSECSKNALRIAIDLATHLGAKIHMVNAVHAHHPNAEFVGSGLIDSIVADYEAQVKESFKELESEIVELQNVPHEADRFLAYLTDAIYTVTKQKDIDLIVMGTREYHDAIEQAIGKRATDLMGMSEVPVIVIPENVKTLNLNKIGLAIDLKGIRNFTRLKFIGELAKQYGGELQIFTVVDSTTLLTSLDQKRIKEVTAVFEGIEVSARSVEGDSIVKGITDFAKAHSLDMIALIPREHSFFNKLFRTSVSKNVALNSEVAILSFHE